MKQVSLGTKIALQWTIRLPLPYFIQLFHNHQPPTIKPTVQLKSGLLVHQQYYNIIYFLFISNQTMKAIAQVASFALISEASCFRSIEIVFNQPCVEVDATPKKSPKYRKVGKGTKALLMGMVESGSSIVSAANKLGINYSTAKSIIQAKNKEAVAKSAHHCLTDDSQDKAQSKQLLESF